MKRVGRNITAAQVGQVKPPHLYQVARPRKNQSIKQFSDDLEASRHQTEKEEQIQKWNAIFHVPI